MPTDRPAKCFGFVQTFDRKSKRRLFEVLKAQGMQMNQQVTFLTDGGDDVHELPLYLNPHAEHLLDWFHLTMRLTGHRQVNGGQPPRIGMTVRRRAGESGCQAAPWRPTTLRHVECRSTSNCRRVAAAVR